jgi:hypothetical protein
MIRVKPFGVCLRRIFSDGVLEASEMKEIVRAITENATM